jgi:nicotinamide-nucleotide amidase
MPATPTLTTPALVARLAELLQSQKLLLSCAESCTGGLLAGACTELSGSSNWFERGFVSYSNEAKTELLGVDAELISTHGAVSEPVARAMAQGALAHSRAQVAVAVTGVAGPTGGSPAKPVGTVCFGFALPGHVLTETRCFDGDRAAVRAAAVRHALQRLTELLAPPASYELAFEKIIRSP